MKKILLLFFSVICAVFLLLNSKTAAQSISENIAVCMNILIPSLFSFMFLSVFIVRSGLADLIGRPAEPIFRKLFKLPGCACGAMLTAFIGGYPAGAKSVVELYKGGRITALQAKRMINFCFCSGPAFMVGTVGSMYLGIPEIGAIIALSQVIGAIIIALISSIGEKYIPSDISAAKSEGICDAFVSSAYAAASSMLSICTMVLIFGVIKSAVFIFIDHNSFLGTLISNLLEITGDLDCAAKQSLAYIAFVTTFGGLCVHIQVFSFARILRISKIKFLLYRLLHSAITTVTALLLIKFMPIPADTAAIILGKNIPTAVPSVAGSAALMLLCVVTVLLLPQNTMDFSMPLCYNGAKKKRM